MALKAPKGTKKQQKTLKSTTNLKSIDTRIQHKFIKLKKHLSGKK